MAYLKNDVPNKPNINQGVNGILGISQERHINLLGSFDIRNGIGVYIRVLSIYPLNTCSYHGTM
jgi:hypothetical protein